jgi:RNA polymerase sigma-70 factor (ECF subfamily)
VPNLSEVDDIQLLKNAQDGNAEAFGELYERYAQRVFRFLYAHLSNQQDAEDLTGEVFLAFLFRIARNALIDHYRRTGKPKQDVSIDDVLLQDQKPSPGDMVAANLEHQEIRETLDQLRDDYRTVLVLRFLSELSPDETAQVMGRSPGAVRVLQHRALASLRTLIENTQG